MVESKPLNEMSLEELADHAYQVRSLDTSLVFDIKEMLSPGKRHEYSDFVEKVLVMRTTIEAAEIQAETNERLVRETQDLVRWTRRVAAATIFLALVTTLLAAVAIWGVF